MPIQFVITLTNLVHSKRDHDQIQSVVRDV